jgi:hypothetical protein
MASVLLIALGTASGNKRTNHNCTRASLDLDLMTYSSRVVRRLFVLHTWRSVVKMSFPSLYVLLQRDPDAVFFLSPCDVRAYTERRSTPPNM